MKKFFYFVFSLFFRLGTLRPVREKRVAMLSPHHENFNDSLGRVAARLREIGGFEIGYISTSALNVDKSKLLRSLKSSLLFFTRDAFFLASSKYVFLNDNFMPMADLNFSKDAVIAQLWHAEGAFKRFGLHLDLPEDVRQRTIEGNKRLTLLSCTSDAIRGIYADAFGIPKEKSLALGSPRTDRFFESTDITAMRQKFDAQHPECAGKKLVLYAPTFRDEPSENRRLLDSLDIEEFNRRLGEEFVLLLRLHPQLHAGITVPGGAIDLTEYPDVGELVLLCDVLVTDYSSICMDFVLLDKPCIFYAFDLDKFNSGRSFYFDFVGVPGPIVKTFDELLTEVGSSGNIQTEYREKILSFKQLHLSSADGSSTQRVIDTVMPGLTQK